VPFGKPHKPLTTLVQTGSSTNAYWKHGMVRCTVKCRTTQAKTLYFQTGHRGRLKEYLEGNHVQHPLLAEQNPDNKSWNHWFSTAGKLDLQD
jgi:hypothetical protein